MRQILVIALLLTWTNAGYGGGAEPWQPADGFGGILIAIFLLVLLIAAMNWYSNKKNPDQEKIDSWTWFEKAFWFGGRPFETINKKKKGKNQKDR